ncbi:MAG: PilZ domain protein [Syntrophus sp. PtaB.Bin001]|nr:MAG: PilZ domain protein [Syntrophus sp. PtaB.Bin001]
MAMNMIGNVQERSACGETILNDNPHVGEELRLSWLFRHSDLIRDMTIGDTIKKQKLTNILNLIHFKGDFIYAILKHPRYEEKILAKIHPEPCLGDTLFCRWDQAYKGYGFERYSFQYLLISHDQSVILAQPRLISANDDGLTMQLPELSPITSKRKSPRFQCNDVKAELFQNGFHATGEVVDFSPHAFRVRIQGASSALFYRFDKDLPATIRLYVDDDVFYVGNCRHMYQQQSDLGVEIVVRPYQIQRKRNKDKIIRNPRKQGLPAISAIFEHPLMNKTFQRKIADISTSGFSIRDKADAAVLVPGMIIPKMTITYAGLLKIHCKTQVVYRKDESSTRFGLAIMDMGIEDYNKLNQLLNNIPDNEEDMINEVDPDELWELLFDSNFIYPAKYKHIQAFREDFRVTYKKLYNECPAIAKHFTYQKDGRIYSHISLLRAYERAWMVHHHAARARDGVPTGLIVLKQMISYLYDLRRLPSAMLDYFICYFRPGNKFTDRIYTGFARQKLNPQVCSLDRFAYISHRANDVKSRLPEGWTLRGCSKSDLWELEQFYMHHSGGLLLDVLDMKNNPQPTLEQVYAQQGFYRKWQALALHSSEDLKAVIIKEESDVAINLSDLLNGFKIFVVDPDLSLDVLLAAVENIARAKSTETYPLMIYPVQYAENKNLGSDENYMMWILNAQHANEFIEYIMKRFRMILN